MLAKNCSTAVVNLLLSVVSGNRLSSDSIKKMRRAVLISKHRNHDSTESTADTLIRMLEEIEGMYYCYITGSYDEALDLVRVRKVKKKRRKSKKRRRRQFQNPAFDDLAVESDERLDNNDVTEPSHDKETNSYVKSVVNALTLGDGEVLLAVAWVTKEGREYHRMFPRILGMDVKYGTNNEKRPMCRLVGKTAGNRNIPIMNCYMPSQQRYAYSFVLNEAVQYCLDANALQKTEIILTDEDKDEMDALNMALSQRTIFGPRARHRLCKWHKVSCDCI